MLCWCHSAVVKIVITELFIEFCNYCQYQFLNLSPFVLSGAKDSWRWGQVRLRNLENHPKKKIQNLSHFFQYKIWNVIRHVSSVLKAEKSFVEKPHFQNAVQFEIFIHNLTFINRR
jgi:hypothetical protein